MNRWIGNALGISGIVGIVLAIIGAFSLNKHLIIAIDSYREIGANSGKLLSKMNGTIDAQTASCAGDRPCRSLIGNLNKTAIKIQDISVTTQRQVAQSSKLVDAASKSLSQTSASITIMADALSQTARQGAQTLAEAQTTIRDLQPLEASLMRTSDASTLAVQHFDALVQSSDLSSALHHVNDITASGDAILADGRRVSDKLTDDYLAPKPWYRKITRLSGDLFDYGALAARHIP